MNRARHYRPEEIARLDQIRARLSQLVTLVADHMRVCPSTPAGICTGEWAGQFMEKLNHHETKILLEEAACQLAAARNGGPR